MDNDIISLGIFCFDAHNLVAILKQLFGGCSDQNFNAFFFCNISQQLNVSGAMFLAFVLSDHVPGRRIIRGHLDWLKLHSMRSKPI